jgi:subtilisin-like proprotein convertase family protein
MRSLRLVGLAVLVMLAAMPVALSARWVDFGSVTPYGQPGVTLLRSGQNGVSITIDVPGLTAEEIVTDRGPFTLISVPGAGVTTDIGAPLLPVIREHVEIPQGASPRLRIVSADYVEAPLSDLGIANRLYPAQPPIPKVPGAIESAEFVVDNAAYAARGFSPGVAASLGEVGDVRAHRFVELNVNPVQYDAAAGTVRYLRSIEVQVDFVGADWPATRAALARYASPDFDEFAAQNFVNAAAFTDRALLTLPIGYLIIVHDAFYEEIEMLAGLRHRLGYETTVVKTSQIPGGVTTTAIKAYIQSAYDTWDVPPTFILLVGDTPQVPCFTGSSSTSGSDLYYTTMGGSSDWLPDIYIGRFSCQTEAQVTALADKTTKYLRFALASGTDWIKKATFMASSDNYTVSEGTHNYVINTWLIPAGYTCNKRYCQTYGATIAQVIADINAGISQLTYSGHGDVNSWSDGPAMNAAQVTALTNVDKLPIVQSYSCLTGQLESACFGETWTNAPNGTALFWGSSTYSYWTEDDVLEKGVYDAWFGDGYAWARGAFNQGLWDVYTYYSGGGRTRSYYEQYNLFGDPAFDTWTNPPAALAASYNPVFPVGGGTFSIDVSGPSRDPEANALVCLYMDGQVYETAYTDANGHADIVLSSPPTTVGTMEVWVSKHDFAPHSGSVEVIVPVTYTIVPSTVPISTTTGVTVTVWDDDAQLLPGVAITIDGWGIDAVVDTTDANGEAHLSVTPPYGENLTVVGREVGQGYNCFTDVLPVTGGVPFTTPDIQGNTPIVGLFGEMVPGWDGDVWGTAVESFFDIYLEGCGISGSWNSGASNTVDVPVHPTVPGVVHAALGKNGYNVYLEDIVVQMWYGTIAGEVYETAGRAPVVGAKLKGYPAGADTTGLDPLFEATTGTGGTYAIADELEVGPYDVYVSKFGYMPLEQQIFVTVGANDEDFYLESAPSGVVSGVVTETGTGTPLYATVKAYRSDDMTLYAETTSDPVTGAYSIELPYFGYEFRVRAYHHIPATRGVDVNDPTETEDFVLEPTLANILVLSDGVTARGDVETVKVDKSGNVLAVVEGELDGAKSASQIALDLVALGYDVVEETAAASNPATWPSYDFIVSASGDNTSPVASATYRAALESYVAAGGKLLLEGGEVAYDAQSYPGYPTFAANVCHVYDWTHDSSGNLVPYATTHPLMATPNVIGTIAFTYVNYGDEDASLPTADAVTVSVWSSYTTDASVIVYDDNPAPQSGQIVFFQFDYLAAGTGRMDLLENAVVYLTALETPPDGSIAGRACLEGEGDHSGIKVTAMPGGNFAYTAVDGTYVIEGMYDATYTVTATKDGWSTAVETGVVVSGGLPTGGVDFLLYPTQTAEQCISPALAIPDNNPTGVYSTLTFMQDVTISDVEIYLNLTHTYIGDLIVEIRSPEGTTVRLHNRGGGSADNIIGWYDSTLPVAGPGSLADFAGEHSAGEWRLWVSDNASIDVGTVNTWCVKVVGGAPTAVDEGETEAPVRYELVGARPNPFNPMTSVVYGAPQAGAVRVSVYSAGGREVRVLVDGPVDAGYHEVVWDGRDGSGTPMASGVYFVRMDAPGYSGSVKAVLLK